MKNLDRYIANRDKFPLEYNHFKEMFQHTLRWEGGSKLHKIKGDSGGWTKYGIAYNKNKHLFTDINDFFDTTYDEAVLIAFSEYYLPIEAYRMSLVSQVMYFDMAYNLGTNRAIRYMQRCGGVVADGKIGPKTRSIMLDITKDCLYKQRNNWYYYLGRTKQWAKKFLKGWLNRSRDIYSI